VRREPLRERARAQDGDPLNPYDAKGLLKTAIAADPDPVFFLESERMLNDMGEVPTTPYDIPLGQADIKRPGTDCTIVSFGRPVHFCLEAAEQLAAEGIDCEVVDGRTIRPLDIETIVRSVRKTNYCVVVDQSWPFASVASEVAMQITERAFDDLDHAVARVCADDVPAPYAKRLEQAMLPHAGKIVHAVKAVTYNL
jgi:pyruvate dehydrogenase E1 component beta subunit